MHNLVTEESPEFENIDQEVKSYRHRVNYDMLALDVRAMLNKCHRGEKAHLTLEYPHGQISNVITALRRRDLDNNQDYRITRCSKGGDEARGIPATESIIISAV